MILHDLEGHEDARRSVATALSGGRLPQALLLHGPPGVGKQRFALWMGQLLLCESPAPDAPCHLCRGCRLAVKLEHPDLHWFFPVKRPPSRGSRERDDEALENARRERLEALRAEPLQGVSTGELLGLHLGTVRNLRRRASRRPSMAPRQVFVVAQAEELVSQESSPEAANALLKVLEEPPSGTWFLLTSGEPGRLLPTIRSRTSALYLPSLPPERVADFLARTQEVDPETAALAARLSSGAIGRALGFLPSGEDPGPLETIRRDAFTLLRAALSTRGSDRYLQALSHPPSGARGLQELLRGLGVWLRDLAAVAAGSPDAALNQDGVNWLSRTAREQGIHPLGAIEAAGAVEEARAQAAGNVNPQLLLAGLLLRIRRALLAGATPAHPEARTTTGVS